MRHLRGRSFLLGNWARHFQSYHGGGPQGWTDDFLGLTRHPDKNEMATIGRVTINEDKKNQLDEANIGMPKDVMGIKYNVRNLGEPKDLRKIDTATTRLARAKSVAGSSGERRVLIRAYVHSVALWDAPWVEFKDKDMFHFKNKAENVITGKKQIGRRSDADRRCYGVSSRGPIWTHRLSVIFFGAVKKLVWKVLRKCDDNE